MDFLRRNAFLLICAAAGIGGIVLIMTGLGAMPQVVAGMDTVKGLYTDLGTLQNSGANERTLQAERERIEAVQADYDRVVAESRKLYRYQPLVEGVFPEGRDELRRDFRVQYNKAIRDFSKELRAGQPAGPNDVQVMKEKIANEKKRAEESKTYTGTDTGPSFDGPARTPAGVLTRAGAKENAKVRADLAAAQRIYCYVTPIESAEATRGPGGTSKATPSFDYDPSMKETGSIDAPLPEECWRAQISYWIQKDVVDAIAAVNNEAAEEALKSDADRWVGIMPVKEIISIRVGIDYVPAEGEVFGGAKPGGFDAALPPTTPETVFTRNGQSPTYEVVQFTVKLIMDQRDIPRLIEKLTANGFHTLLRVGYKAEPPNKDMTDKIYGSEPVANVVMDFETVMLGEVFRQWMPGIVCENYGITCPSRDGAEDKG